MALTEASAFKDGSINTADIADNAVTTAKIADLNVTSAKIATDAVTTSKIANANITGAKLAQSSVGTGMIVDGAVTQAKINSAVIFTPVGTVITYAGSTAPTGYLKANGDTIPDGSGTVQGITADFSALYAIVGGTLPDLRGEFIRGVDDSRGIDSGRQIRSTQSDNFKNHQHEFGADDQVRSQGGYTSLGTFAYDATSNVSGGGQRARTKNDNTNSGGTETRPRNVALLMCIKF